MWLIPLSERVYVENLQWVKPNFYRICTTAYEFNPLKTDAQLNYTHNSVPTSQRTLPVSTTTINQSLLFTETNAVCEDGIKHKNTLCGENAEADGGTHTKR
jgi:hypothetical protein